MNQIRQISIHTNLRLYDDNGLFQGTQRYSGIIADTTLTSFLNMQATILALASQVIQDRGFILATADQFDDSTELRLGNSLYRVDLSDLNGSSFVMAQNSIQNWGSSNLPSAPTNLQVTGAGQNQAQLTWTYSGVPVISFDIQRKDSGNYKSVGSSSGTNFLDNNLTPGTTYTYKVRGHSILGYGTFSTSASYTNPLITIPIAPSNCTAQGIALDSILVLWQDNSDNEQGFYIEHSQDGVTFLQVGAVGPGVTYFVDPGLATGTTFAYRVRAFNTAGNSSYSNVASGTTLTSGQVGVPPPPTNLVVTPLSDLAASVSWAPGSTSETCFILERSEGVTWKEILRIPAGTYSASDMNGETSTSYQWRVRAMNLNGISSPTDPVQATFLATNSLAAPTAPSGLVAYPSKDTEMFLAWKINDIDALGYNIEKLVSSTWTWVASAPALVGQWFVGGLSANTSYSFRVKAFNSFGESSVSNTATTGTLVSGHVASPTGRNPRFLWNPEWQNTWVKAKHEADTSQKTWGADAYKKLKTMAGYVNTGNERTGDHGLSAVLLYQITGSSSYSASAINYFLGNSKMAGTIWDTPNSSGIEPASLNQIRDEVFDKIVAYDWLYPAMSSGQRLNFINAINFWLELVSGGIDPRFGTRNTDSDQTQSDTFAFAIADSIPENPKAGTFLGSDTYSVEYPIGGLDPTGLDRNSLRNTIEGYARMADGGGWFESSEYNGNTVSYIGSAINEILALVGIEHYAQHRKVLRDATLQQIHQMAPTLDTIMDWGDITYPSILYPTFSTHNTVFAGASKRLVNYGPYMQSTVDYMWHSVAGTSKDKYSTSANPYSRAYLFLDPYAPETDYKTLSKGLYCKGIGHFYYHTGWTSGDSFFGSIFEPRVSVDHQLDWLGGYKLYRNGEWALTYPSGYGPQDDLPEGVNSITVAGLGGVREVRGSTVSEWGNSYGYIQGSTYGSRYKSDSWNPPPVFLQELTRTLFYLSSSDKSVDTVISYDRVLANNPFNLLSVNRYNGYTTSISGAVLSGSISTSGFTIGVPTTINNSLIHNRIYFQTGPNSGTFQSIRSSIPNGISATDITLWNEFGHLPGSGDVFLYGPIGISDDYTRMKLAPWFIYHSYHSPVKPTISGDKISWKSVGGKNKVQLTSVSPSGIPSMVVDDIQYGANTFLGNELKSGVWVGNKKGWPIGTLPQFETFVQVLQATNVNSTSILTNIHTESTSGEMEGVLVQRSGLNDVLVMFGASPKIRTRYAGCTIHWTGNTGDVYLTDLSPSRTWHINIDGGSTTILSVSQNGVAHATVTGVGNHTIVLS